MSDGISDGYEQSREYERRKKREAEDKRFDSTMENDLEEVRFCIDRYLRIRQEVFATPYRGLKLDDATKEERVQELEKHRVHLAMRLGLTTERLSKGKF